MKTKNNIITIAATVLVLVGVSSCTKELDIEPPANRQLVLNGEPLAGTRAFVNFAYTRFFLDNNNDQPVPGAEVTLVANGVRYSSDSLSKCNYFFPYTIQEDDSLAVEVSLPDGRTVNAETWVPFQPVVEDFTVQFRRTLIFNILDARFKLSDHANVNEIYSIAINVRDSGRKYNEWKGTYDTVDTVRTSYFCLPNNPEITSDSVTPYLPMVGHPYMLYGSRIMFLDRRIVGRPNYEVALMIPLFRDTTERAPFKHEYTVEVHSFSAERFRYILSVSSQGGATSFFAEQGSTYGNVDGALGVFAGGAGQKFKFAIDTIVPERYRTTTIPDDKPAVLDGPITPVLNTQNGQWGMKNNAVK